MAEKLLDFTQPFDVGLLDATVAAFYGTGSKEEVGLSLSIALQGRLRTSDFVTLWLLVRRRTDNLSQAATCTSLFFFFLCHFLPY
jgi:exportin-1